MLLKATGDGCNPAKIIPLCQHPATWGFSLVELSIVLVILGLLTGGILAGQSLIRAAELRAVTTEHSRYVTAMQAFRDKYFALPGDMTNATRFWGAQDGGDGLGVDCTGVSSTSALTCNGNGNGLVEDGVNEMFRYWQHLANAGLIEGTYTGIGAIALPTLAHTIGVNCPRSKLSNAGWAASYAVGGDGGTYAMTYGNIFWFGGPSAHRTQSSILKPEEAWNIDTKVDDGRPAHGKFIVRSNDIPFGTAGSCTEATNNADLAAGYRLASSTVACAFMIKID